MDESEWLACAAPGELVYELNERDAASPRKFRLFSCACCRQVWSLMPEHVRQAVELVERYADNLATDEELDSTFEASGDFPGQYPASDPKHFAASAVNWALWTDGRRCHGNAEGAMYVVMDVLTVLALEAGMEPHPATVFEDWAGAERLCRLFRDIMGNPFRPVAVEPGWLSWNGGAVVRIAQEIYGERAFDRMPLLADALAKASCPEQAVLDHCRNLADHARGCWVIDLLLGKE